MFCVAMSNKSRWYNTTESAYIYVNVHLALYFTMYCISMGSSNYWVRQMRTPTLTATINWLRRKENHTIFFCDLILCLGSVFVVLIYNQIIIFDVELIHNVPISMCKLNLIEYKFGFCRINWRKSYLFRTISNGMKTQSSWLRRFV